MTERLYYTDSYRREFAAAVIATGEDGRVAYLDRTAFYPTSGGQPHDLGSLGTEAVVDVIDEDDGRIAHRLAAPIPLGPVQGTINWPRRFDFMQQHTGQHLLSAIFADRFGWQTVSVHFGDAICTIDLDVPALPPDTLAAAEQFANEEVAANREVQVTFEDAASATGLRKPSDRTGTLRIITIDGLDRSACGGTHVRRTGEIGMLQLRRTERMKQRTRLEFACGIRAVRLARADQESLARVAAIVNSTPEGAAPLVEAKLAELKAAEARRRVLEGEVARFRAAELLEGVVPDASGRRVVVLREMAADADAASALVQAIASSAGAVGIAMLASPPTLFVAAHAASALHAGERLKGALAAVGGRGGGNAQLARGTAPTVEALEAALAALLG